MFPEFLGVFPVNSHVMSHDISTKCLGHPGPAGPCRDVGHHLGMGDGNESYPLVIYPFIGDYPFMGDLPIQNAIQNVDLPIQNGDFP